MMRPQSCERTKRRTMTLPDDLSTSTSATAPQMVSARLETAMPRPLARLAGAPGAFGERRRGARIVFEIAQAQPQRIDFLIGGDLVDEALAGEAARRVA